ncbi:MAG: hypothetical protein HQL33_04155 [Alphaproteobacteria bacterium]|nr:hypothetical protein [Alphaproteobacteria bacterium]MBF0129165.1 hypothetical protein [Alphaproteobacteria bacterium]
MSVGQLYEYVHGRLGHLHLIGRDDLDDDSFYLEKFPRIGALTDDEIERFAAKYLSRVEYEETDYHRVIRAMKRLRALHKGCDA